MLLQPLPPAPDAAFDPVTHRGRVGAYAGQLHEVRWGYYRGWLHGQVRRALVRKRWFQVSVHTPRHLLLVRIQDNGTVGTGRCLGLDRTTGATLFAHEGQGAPLRTLVTGFMAGEGADAFLRAGGADVRLHRAVGETAWTLKARWADVALDWVLDTAGAPPCVLTIGEAAEPLSHRPGLTQQAIDLAARGTTVVGGRTVDMGDAWAQVTYTNAFLPAIVHGQLLSAVGDFEGGGHFALCLSDGDLLGETTERVLFERGQALQLPPVRLIPGPPWRIVSADGTVDLTARVVASAGACESRMAGWVHHSHGWDAVALTGTVAGRVVTAATGMVETLRLQR